MFGKWIVLEGMPTTLKYQITRSILRSYPGLMMHMDVDVSWTDHENILKLKEKIQATLFTNTSVICTYWISTSCKNDKELHLFDAVLQRSRPDLTVALLGASDSEYERKLKQSSYIDLALNVKDKDPNQISRLVLDRLLHTDV